MRLLYKQIPTLHYGALIVAVVTVIVLWGTVPRHLLIGWAALFLLLSGMRLLLVRRFFSRERDDADVLRWRHQTTLVGVFSGSLFGFGGALFVSYADPYQVIFIIVLIFGAVGSAIVAQSAYPPAYATFAFFAVVPFGVSLMLRSETALMWIGALTLVYLLSQFGHGRHLSRMVSEWVRVRSENADLVERLREENQRAEQAVVAKSRFLASASHDLRQPLHALELFVEAQGQEQLAPPAEQLRRRMGASVSALGELINGLLDVSKLEADTVEAAPRPLALAPLFERLKAELGPRAEAAGLRLRLGAGRYWVVSDPQHLERILRNLLDNALKYTRQGAILVVCRRRGDRLAIEVRDTGVGIDPAAQANIFQEFFQAHNPERDSAKGLGLGLAIVKGLADRLGHELEVDSRPGAGSVFRLLLPRSAPGDVPQSAPLVSTGPRGLRVVVVDDDAAIRAGLESVLSGWGCRVAGYESARECIEDAARGWSPDVLLVDFRLREGRTGDADVSALRAFFKRPLPAFVITGETAPEPLRRIAAAGLRVLHKPLQPARLRAALATVAAPH
ncbi:response regulator [Ectothiorhodospiraceae bacterium 2226]|nr:response regulator [Ectothiorhodospiraceae bacterium 2226]